MPRPPVFSGGHATEESWCLGRGNKRRWRLYRERMNAWGDDRRYRGITEEDCEKGSDTVDRSVILEWARTQSMTQQCSNGRSDVKCNVTPQFPVTYPLAGFSWGRSRRQSRVRMGTTSNCFDAATIRHNYVYSTELRSTLQSRLDTTIEMSSTFLLKYTWHENLVCVSKLETVAILKRFSWRASEWKSMWSHAWVKNNNCTAFSKSNKQ